MQSSRTRQAVVVGGLMILFGGLLLIQEFVELSEWIWVSVLGVSGLAVYGIYSVAREEGWMLITSYALLAIGLMIALVTLDILQDAFVATYALLAIGNPLCNRLLPHRTRSLGAAHSGLCYGGGRDYGATVRDRGAG